MLQFFNGTTYYIRVPNFVSADELTYNIKVGEVTANWTVSRDNSGRLGHAGIPFNVQGSGNSTAPGTPISLTATLLNPTENSFSVSWTEPQRPLRVRRGLVEIGSAPTSNTNGFSAGLPDSMPLTCSNPSQQPPRSMSGCRTVRATSITRITPP